MKRRLKVFSGQSNVPLAQEICSSLSIKLGMMSCKKFSNDNIKVRIEESVREDDVFVIQTGYPDVNEAIMELLIIVDALKYASAARITAVLPYYPYVRSDKKDEPRISVTARLVAELLATAGCDRILTMDLHSPQIVGFSRIPVDQLTLGHLIVNHFMKMYKDDLVVVAPDAGSAKMAEKYARRLDIPMVVMDKRRYSDNEKAEVMRVIGDVKGKDALIVDDEVATGNSLIEAVKSLQNFGAKRLYAACTHGVLSSDAIQNIVQSPIEEFVTSNTINRKWDEKPEKITILSVGKLFADAIAAIHMGTSVSRLFA